MASLIAQLVKNLQCRRPWFDFWVGKIPWRRGRLPTPVFLGFSCGSAGKESACNAGDPSSIPGSGRSPGEGVGYPLQCSCLENPHWQRSLAGHSLWGHKESDMQRATKHTSAALLKLWEATSPRVTQQRKRIEGEETIMCSEIFAFTTWMNLKGIVLSEIS